MALLSFEHLKKISNFPKLQGCGSKNEPAIPISHLRLDFLYICQFCCYNLLLWISIAYLMGKKCCQGCRNLRKSGGAKDMNFK